MWGEGRVLLGACCGGGRKTRVAVRCHSAHLAYWRRVLSGARLADLNALIRWVSLYCGAC